MQRECCDMYHFPRILSVRTDELNDVVFFIDRCGEALRVLLAFRRWV